MRAKRCLFVFVVGTAVAASGCGGGEDKPMYTVDSAAEDSLSRMETVLAVVGDMEITAAAVREHMLKRGGQERVDEYMRSPDILQIGMAALVDQYVWAAVARREGVKLTAGEKRRLMNLESELLASRYVADVIEKKAMPSREDVETYYNENQSRYIKPIRVGLRHILVKSRERADAIKAELDGGAEFGELARRYSLDETTKELGGALGYLTAGKSVLGIGRDKDFETAVLAMEEGQAGVVRSAMGFHVVRIEKKDGGNLQPLDEVYQSIADALLPRRFGNIYNEELAKARESTETRYITENFEKFTGTEKNTYRLLQVAENAGEPVAKSEAYRRIAYDFPDSPEAAEALFRMAYVNLVETKDKTKARNALNRLNRKYLHSPWRRAGNFLLENIDEDPQTFGTPEEILAREAKKGR